ncbi:Hypothetical protein R9X50_00486600 [Acrodontium crateriforme]|uniref:Uncharacterized protein n=1 Tax=Acrodontium crateriforme TaxID=150365 RepID=A0AAQ3MBR0_9PEZI|nr:Hypothetical protein R9X50_00486600 [Acrodontium crateriforme]
MAYFDLHTLLSISNPETHKITCVGVTKKNARCRNFFINGADIHEAEHIMADLSTSLRSISDLELRSRLFQVAKLLLCPRWHKDQAGNVAGIWYQTIQRTATGRSGLQTLPPKPVSISSKPLSLVKIELEETKTDLCHTAVRLQESNAERVRLKQTILEAEQRLEQQKTEYETKLRQSEARHIETKTNLEQEIRNITHLFAARIVRLQEDRQLENVVHDREMRSTQNREEKYRMLWIREQQDSILESTLVLREDSHRELKRLESVQNDCGLSLIPQNLTYYFSMGFDISRRFPYIKASFSRIPRTQNFDSTVSSGGLYSSLRPSGSGHSTSVSTAHHKLSPLKKFQLQIRPQISAFISHARSSLGLSISRAQVPDREAIISVDELV